MSRLFEPFALREVTLHNRMVPPMCRYSSETASQTTGIWGLS
jgi:2,4-dienoyl-CoA reductase-like NADH-dependent reductase (Old Yellow Enzyme family)